MTQLSVADSPSENRSVGRKPARERHKSAVLLAEEKLADRLPSMVDALMDQALGGKPEQCTKHKMTLACPHEDKDGNICGRESEGLPANFAALKYAVDRVMGQPRTKTDDDGLSLEVVQRIGRFITQAFLDVNQLPDEETRASMFAQSVAQMWTQVKDD